MNAVTELKLIRAGYKYRETVHPAKAAAVAEVLRAQGLEVVGARVHGMVVLFVRKK